MNNRVISKQNYGSSTTIGPRQVSMLVDIYDMTSSGERATLDVLRFFHGRAINGNSFEALRQRKLVKGSANNLQLTPTGLQIAHSAMNSTVAAGLGVVAVGVREKR
jgi:hypothetical protein